MSDAEKAIAAGAVKDGRETSELKVLWVGMAVSAIIAIAPILLKAVPEGSTVWLVISCLAAIAATVGGYQHSRGKIKAAASIAKGMALGGVPKDPQ